MENKSLKTQNLTNEEEKIINWLQVQESFKKNFGNFMEGIYIPVSV